MNQAGCLAPTISGVPAIQPCSHAETTRRFSCAGPAPPKTHTLKSIHNLKKTIGKGRADLDKGRPAFHKGRAAFDKQGAARDTGGGDR